MSISKNIRAAKVHDILDQTSPDTITFLTQTNPFRLLISVILSAQTTDRQVNEVATALFDRYPTAYDLAQAEVEDVKQIIRSTGYYNAKSRNIITTSQVLVERFDGQVPLSMELRVTLPGVGRKTANVILGQLADQPAIIVDTHFARVVKRIGLTSSSNPEVIEREVASLLPPEFHYRFSMTINLHGRQICHARKPACDSCQLTDWCKAFPVQ